MYYWHKYHAVSNYTTVYKQGSWVYEGATNSTSWLSGAASYSFDSSTGTYTLNGGSNLSPGSSGTVYTGGGGYISRHTWINSTSYGTSSQSAYSSQEFSHYSRGDYISTTTGDYYYKSSGYNSDGYWWERGGTVNSSPYQPVPVTPASNEKVLGLFDITWNIGGDPDGDSVSTEIELSTDGGTTYKTLGSSSYGATKFSYNFANEPATTQAKIRLRHYDGNSYGSYAYSPLFQIIKKTQIGTMKLNAGSKVITIPVYDPAVGMTGKDAFRIKLNNKVGCLELVETTDSIASPLRISTSKGIKAISKG